jgi:hypothetical protein
MILALAFALGFEFSGGKPGALACELAEATRHPYIVGIGRKDVVPKLQVAELDPVLELGKFHDRVAKAAGRPEGAATGALPPPMLVSLGAGTSKNLNEYLAENTQDGQLVRLTDEAKVVFGPTGLQSVSWTAVARALDVKLDVHFAYRETLLAGSASHLEIEDFLRLAASAVGAKLVVEDDVFRVVPDVRVLRQQLIFLHQYKAAEIPHSRVRLSGKFAAEVLKEVPDDAIEKAFAKEGAKFSVDANFRQSELAVEYLLAHRAELPELVQTILDAGCLSRPIGIEVNSDGDVQAAFRGPPGEKQITWFL